MPSLRIAARPFAEQVAFFRRKVNVPTRGWWDLQRADHAHGFMVAGAFKADLLEDFRQAITDAIERGTTLDTFKRQFDTIVQRHGWSYRGGRDWRARVIYETNLRQSYNAGRWAQLTSPDMRQVRPYLQYRHNDRGISRNPRPLHQSWHGLVLRYDDPWWKTHAPQNGWGCKCGIRALSEADLRRLGKAGPDRAPDDGTYEWVSPDGVRHEIPNGIDPGFDYNVGEAARSLPAARRFGERVMQLPEVWRRRALADAATRAADLHADLPAVIEAMLAQASHPRGTTIAAGMLRPATVDFLAREAVVPATAMIAISDAEIAHLVRDAKRDRGSALPEALLRQLPAALAAPDAVLYDTADAALIYAWRQADGRYAKVVVRPDYRRKGALLREPANWIRSGGLIDRVNLLETRYRLIEGAL